MKIIWSDPAREDILGIADYIAKDSPVNARHFIEKLKAQADNITLFPRKHRVVPEFKNDHIREVLVGKYRIVFQIVDQSQTIIIQAVIHGSRDISSPDNQRWDKQ